MIHLPASVRVYLCLTPYLSPTFQRLREWDSGVGGVQLVEVDASPPLRLRMPRARTGLLTGAHATHRHSSGSGIMPGTSLAAGIHSIRTMPRTRASRHMSTRPTRSN
jgi:hypothetical protein